MQVLLYQMKHDTYLDTTSKSYDTLNILKLIKKKILDQTKDQYCYATVYDQEFALYVFHLKNLTNEQYYEQFHTKFDVGEAIGVTRQCRVLMEYTEQETSIFFMNLFQKKNCK